MSARLVTRCGVFEGLDARFEEEATIGRSADNTVVLDSGSVSKRHARIYQPPDADGYLLEDLGSLNGTKLDGLRVRGAERLAHLSVVSFGGSGDLVFQDLERCARRIRERAEVSPDHTREDVAVAELPPSLSRTPSRAAQPQPQTDRTEEDAAPLDLPKFGQGDAGPDLVSPDRTMVDQVAMDLPSFLGSATESDAASAEDEAAPSVQDPPGAGQLEVAQPVLEVSAGDSAGGENDRRFELIDGLNVFGRADGCEIQVLSEHLSRRHAVLRVAEGKVYVRDLGSKNGTIVDGVAIEDEVELLPGKEILVGNVRAWWR